MKKVVLFISLIFVSFLAFSNEANAVPVGIKFGSSGQVSDLVWRAEGGVPGDPTKPYIDHEKWVVYQGHNYPAYCVDPGLALSGKSQYNCTPSSDAGLVSIMNQAGDAMGPNYNLYQLAFRMYASVVGIGNFMNLTFQRAAIIRYTQIKTGQISAVVNGGSFGKILPANADAYLSGSIVETAWGIASGAIANRSGSLVTGSSGLSWTKQSDSGGQITYLVTSPQSITKMKFKCLENCTLLSGEESGWSGTQATVKISVPNCKPFTIAAYYIPDGVQICTNSNSSIAGNTQVLITKFTAEGTTIDTTQPTEKYTDASQDPTKCEGKCNCPKTDEIIHAVSNCCNEAGALSYAMEPELDGLFCEYKGAKVHVNRYCPAKFADKYLDRDVSINNYCKLYCTERVQTTTAGSQTAKQGMNFELTQQTVTWLKDGSTHQTALPYVSGAKRCRMVTDYDAWHEDFMAAVRKQRDKYNEYQKQIAFYHTWDDAIKNKETEEWTLTVTFGENKSSKTCTSEEWEEKKANCTVTATETCKEKKSDSVTVTSDSMNPPGAMTRTITVYKYKAEDYNDKYPYHKIMIDDTKEKDGTIHKEVTFKYSNVTKNPTDTYVYWGDDQGKNPRNFPEVKELDAAYNEWVNKSGSGTENTDTYKTGKSTSATCYSGDTKPTASKYSLKSPISDPYIKRQTYLNNANSQEAQFNSYADKAKNLENAIDKCDNWFTKYDGKNAESHYEFKTDLTTARFSQVYVENFTTPKIAFTDIPKSGGCWIKPTPDIGVDGKDVQTAGEFDDKEYSKDGSEWENSLDMKRSDLVYEKETDGWKKYLDTAYNIHKRFVYDARYQAECYWEEQGKTLFTIYPSGEATFMPKSTYTENDYVYSIFSTTYEATYEVEFFMKGIGSKDGGVGKFDKYWNEADTCSGESEAQHTCQLHVEDELILETGCPPEVPPIDPPTVCSPPKNPDVIINFKIVDPIDLFPGGTVSGGEEYARNWTKTSYGTATMDQMKQTAQADATYAPANISYEFKLGAAEMNRIKDYNAKMELGTKGGYNNNSLICEERAPKESCRRIDGTNTCYRSKGNAKCMSSFIKNAYNGTVDSRSVDITVGDLNTARTGGNVHWAPQ